MPFLTSAAFALALLEATIIGHCAPWLQSPQRPPIPTTAPTAATMLAGKTIADWELELFREKKTNDQLRSAIEAIGPEHVPKLMQAHFDFQNNAKTWRVAMLALSHGSKELKQAALPELLNRLEASFPSVVRSWAAATLGDYCEFDQEVVPKIMALCKDPDAAVANAATVALAKLRKAAIIRHVCESNLYVRQFYTMYPSAISAISHFDDERPPIWQSNVGIHGRYELALRFKIKVDRNRMTAAPTEPPKFYLTEVKEIKMEGKQVRGVSYNSASNRVFGTEEWKKLKDKGGDLSVLGIVVNQSSPLLGFEQAWRP